MFNLAVLNDSVRIHPRSLQSSLNEAVIEVLNGRFCNRVIAEVGLGMGVYDILEVDDPYVHPGESHASVKVKFRLIVFRPFVGEVLEGRIRSCTEEGISVSLAFFDDIFIPLRCLQAGTIWNGEERLWVWNYDGNELFMDLEEKVRFRVLQESFTEVAPVQKESLLAAVANKLNGVSADISEIDQKLAMESGPVVPPYKVIATIAEDGLGLVSWWRG